MPALTGVRFPLALWVVTHHLSGPGRMFEPLTARSGAAFALFDAAWVALPVFFAISGLVLARRYHDTSWTRSTLASYAVARFGRVYPLYFFSLIILVPIINQELARPSLGSPAEKAGLLVNHLLLFQGWHRPFVNWNTPAWSLSCELFFYAVFPIVIMFVRRGTLARLAAASCVAFALPVALRLLLEAPISKPLLYLGDFVVGVVAGRLYDELNGSRARLSQLGPWLYGPALSAAVLLLWFRDSFGSFLVVDAGLRLMTAMFVFGLACGGGLSWRWLSSRFMQAAGRASFAIYILHIPVLWWFDRTDLRTALSPVAAGMVYLALVLVLSFVVSRHIEEPANSLIRRGFARRRARGFPGRVADVALPLPGSWPDR